MRVLIDTNVFIHREDYHVLPEYLQELVEILNTENVRVLVHPESIEEVKRNGNEERRKISLSKIRTYPMLESPPQPNDDKDFLGVVGYPLTSQENADNALLYAVHKDAVDFLISDDKGIHNKALRIDLRERVLSGEEALALFQKIFLVEEVKRPPALQGKPVHNLNLDDPFFNSLKKEYPDFPDWFRRVSRQGRKCWVYYEEDGSIGALLIYKREDEPVSSVPPVPRTKRLKLCTFKVAHTGFKIGELFIKLAVKYCVENDIAEMYLTHYPKKEDYFADLLHQYGFLKTSRIDGEDVYLKRLGPARREVQSLFPHEISRIYYPTFYDGARVRKFVVPIRPEYHNRLFIDYKGRQTTIPEHAGEFIIEGNTISKVYLSHSKIRRIWKGDILLFYRSKDKKELTSLGVVENVFHDLKDKDQVVRLVGKRTVYTVEEIEQIVRKPTLVIFFRWHFDLPKPLKIAELKRLRVLPKAPQSIATLHHRKYMEIKREGKIDERYTVH